MGGMNHGGKTGELVRRPPRNRHRQDTDDMLAKVAATVRTHEAGGLAVVTELMGWDGQPTVLTTPIRASKTVGF